MPWAYCDARCTVRLDCAPGSNVLPQCCRKHCSPGPATTPRRWITMAGWSKFRSLDRALFEFAHANRESRLDAAAILNDHRNDPDNPISQRAARQTTFEQLRPRRSRNPQSCCRTSITSIADTMREALHQRGLTSPPTQHADNPTSAPHHPARHTTPPQPPTHHS